MHQHLFRAQLFGEAVGEPCARIDLVELDVPEGVARDFLARFLHRGNDFARARAFGDEEVHAVLFVHDRAQPLGLCRNVEAALGHVDAVDVPPRGGVVDPFRKGRGLHPVVMLARGRRGQPTAIAPHNLVHDQHARIGGMFGDDVAGKDRALLRRRPRAKRLLDRDDVIVDGLGQAHDGQVMASLQQMRREVGGGGVGVVSANRVQHIDPVARQLRRSDRERVFALFDQPALHAVFLVGQFDPAVADRASAKGVQAARGGAHLRRGFDAVSRQQPGIAVAIGDDADIGRDFAVPLDQAAHGGTEAGRKPARGEHGDSFYSHSAPCSAMLNQNLRPLRRA